MVYDSNLYDGKCKICGDEAKYSVGSSPGETIKKELDGDYCFEHFGAALKKLGCVGW